MKQPSVPFLHLLTCTQAIKAIKAIKRARCKMSQKKSEVWSPKGFPNLARCFILSLWNKRKSKISLPYMSGTVNWYLR